MTLPVEKWAEQVRAGEVRAVSRAITAIENHQPEAETLLRLLFPHTGQAYLTGVTGAPGRERARWSTGWRAITGRNRNKLA